MAFLFLPNMIQISDTILLRPFAITDADTIAKYANNLNIASNLRDSFPFPYDKSDAEHFIFNYAGHYPYKVFAIELNNEAVGSVGFFIYNDIYRLNVKMIELIQKGEVGVFNPDTNLKPKRPLLYS